MSEEENLKRKSARIAAHEAAKRIKKEATLVVDGEEVEEEEEEDSSSSDEAQGTSKTLVNATSSSSRSRRGRKRKLLNEFTDPTLSPSEAQAIYDLSKKVGKILKAKPPSSDDGQKRRRGRPCKYDVGPSSPASARRKRSMTYKNSDLKQGKGVRCDIVQRRETYNTSPVNDEPIIPTIFSSPKQLVPGSGGISYKESLMKFSKDLGPTAQRVAGHMLSNSIQDLQQQSQPQPQRQPLLPPEPESWHEIPIRPQQQPQYQPVLQPRPQTQSLLPQEPESWREIPIRPRQQPQHQPRPQPQPLLPPEPVSWREILLRLQEQPLQPRPEPQPFFHSLYPSLNENQADQPFLSIGGSSEGRSIDVTGDYKGKKVMIEEDRKKGPKNCDLGNSLQFLLANPKGGVKISDVSPSEAPKACVADVNRENNLAHHQSSNQKIMNQISSFLAETRRTLNENNPKNFHNNDATRGMVNFLKAFQAAPGKNVMHKPSVLPSTYIRPSRKNSDLSLSLGGVTSSFPSVPPPSMLVRPPSAVRDPTECRIAEPATPQPGWSPSTTTVCDPLVFRKFLPSPPKTDPPSLAVTDTMQYQVQEPPPPPVADGDPKEFQLQDYAENLLGKDAFLEKEPLVIGPLTELMSLGLNPNGEDRRSISKADQK